ncbi:MAG TPA: substrate-binding domain-containing protein [Planktothrix sp.]|jgi:D-allose transport system substrate-binding protein
MATCSSALAADKYIFILPSLGNPYWQIAKQGIEDGAMECGISCTILSAVSDTAKEEHLSLCQTAIAQKPAMIVVCTTTTSIGLQCLKEAQSHGIKTGVLDGVISVEEAKKAGINLGFSVGTNNVAVGEKAADFIAGQNKLPAPKVLVIEGMVGNNNSAQRVSGFKQEFLKKVPNAKIVNSVSAEWDRLRALNLTADTLTRTPDLNIIFAANDMMALGAVEAVRNAGKTKDIIVVGVDGVVDARKAIVSGRMTASVAQLPYLIGKRSAELAKETVEGKCSAKTEKTPLLVLTKPVLESKTDPLMKYVR